jgi:hypothetical protein
MNGLNLGRCALSVCAAAALLAACGGSQPPIVVPGAIAQGEAASGNVARSPGFSQLARRALRIYTGFAGSILFYPATANGNAPARLWISGHRTRLFTAWAVYFAPSGSLYVANYAGYPWPRTLGFAPNARGNVAPTRNIGGSNNPVGPLFGVAVYAGRVAVVGLRDAVVVWGRGRNGNAKPTGIISGPATKLKGPVDDAFDDGGRLYVTNSSNHAITVYAPNAAGNAAPVRLITGSLTRLSYPRGLCIDRTNGLIYVANSNDAITAYRLLQSGNVRPTVMIRGDKTRLRGPTGVAVDAAGYVYVANTFSNIGSGRPFLTVYAPGSNGNVAPVQTVIGSNVDIGPRIAVR